MDAREKALYHQIHPAKLATDVAGALASLYLFWQGEVVWGLVVTLVPSILASVLVIRYADLETLRGSPAGRYLGQYMTRSMQAARLVGNLVMIVGAWYHVVWLILAGLVIIVGAWFRGKLWP